LRYLTCWIIDEHPSDFLDNHMNAIYYILMATWIMYHV